jgi:hypothetical protein
MRQRAAIAAFLAVLTLALPALAEGSDNESWDGSFGKKAERRSDVVLGLSTGLVLTSADGYPNEVAKLNNPAYEAKSGLALGPAAEAWLGGALTDWFSFGLGGAYLRGSGNGSKSSGGAFLVRIEAFPLYELGGGLRDLAVFANFGAGGISLDGENDKHAAAGFASIGGGGVAYEVARFGHFALAPSAEYLLIASQTLTAHQAIIGARVVFYGGPS